MCSREYEQVQFDGLPLDHKTSVNVDVLSVIPKASH